MLNQNQRRHARTREKSIIRFGFLHQSPRYLGFVQNTSRYGIYFLSEKPLTVGSFVSIQPWRCGDDPPHTASPAIRDRAGELCSEGSDNAHHLKAMVIGRVVHCQRMDEEMPAAYGIGAHYESPSV